MKLEPPALLGLLVHSRSLYGASCIVSIYHKALYGQFLPPELYCSGRYGMLIWAPIVMAGIILAIVSYAIIESIHSRIVKRRLQAKAATWPCPNCGKLFGEDAFTPWLIGIFSSEEPLLNHCSKGALMKCSHCGKEFRFDPAGRRIDEGGFYINNEKPE